ncbi:hypothetical protein BN137_2999 [Cronobacter condimenti 1330]|uniref:K+-transporting ATPase, F subunit n=1 Tax=Cronobacter condimenti 1330 TaxID=1073999 RepID=K8A2R8_9ENTR|nr:hypothetical protein BN137_2999 [Cronobacter condimenti 1330]
MRAFGSLYFFYTLPEDFCEIFAPESLPSAHIPKTLWRWIVSAGLITGVVLVFLLLGYLVYALINAEAF